jgi:phosphoribosyl 1,2-cyclic phosphodiesterase
MLHERTAGGRMLPVFSEPGLKLNARMDAGWSGSSCRIAPTILNWPACQRRRERVPFQDFRSRMSQTMAVQFAVLSSGSRGNSTLICGKGAGLLIDVGVGPKVLGERLESVGSSWSRIASVVLTHTHADHVDTATFNELARRGVTVHCHEEHREALALDPGFKKLEESRAVRCYDDHPFLVSNGLRLEPIEVSHDGGPTFGFRIEASSERREPPVGIGYLADCGCWSGSIAESLAGVDLIGLEFNHDVEMQKASPRPDFLIERNLGDRGHLSNAQAALLLEAVLSRSHDGAPRHVVLLHLSEQCNQPELALETARAAIQSSGREAQVHVARQTLASPSILLSAGRGRGRGFGLSAGAPATPRARKRSALKNGVPGQSGLLHLEPDADPESLAAEI